ncbi:MAG: mandelate racemase/muconate lactonizing enzyme family protein [Chloroflexi bacterium]|nr:mandelate racemase/muconate lactonizing enzyme family protein [Chloroflexota bacterium]
MKIASHEIVIVDLPLERPFMGRTVMRHAILKLRTDDGIDGLGWAMAAGPMGAALVVAIDGIAELLHGEDPMMREQIDVMIDRVTGSSGPGMTHYVRAVVNIALWDITGKAVGQPIWKLLGGAEAETVETYASGWLWRDYSLDELTESAGELAGRGFTSMKFRCGAEARMADEAERARVVRAAVGDDVTIMVDINQGWDIPRTMSGARHFEAQNVYWLEDPIDYRDLRGYEQLVNSLDIAITHGEYNYGFEPFGEIVHHGAADIVMIDAHHVGGIDAWKRAADIAAGAHRPVVTHLSPEIGVHLAAGVPHTKTVEFMPWSFGLWEKPMEIDDAGRLIVPQEPGLGVSLNEDVVKAHRVDA